MNLFDKLVAEALENQPTLSPLRIAVEKELLHHDILSIMRNHHLMTDLTFIGGTCLRTCYGGIRLSEDLDFTGGLNFSRKKLSTLAQILTQNLQEKYGLQITVSEPTKDKQDVDTWKVKVETRPKAKSFPAQRINIDICALPSYEPRPMMLLNPYQVDMGTSGLIIQAQSCEEIYADKLIAFALRPNRIKYRDIWDILWMHGKGIKPRVSLIPGKLKDRNHPLKSFLELFNERLQLLKNSPEMIAEFKQEMLRFLPVEQVTQTFRQEDLWDGILQLFEELHSIVKRQRPLRS
jgi:predicted nucleotidyltransferase component of viral defense system